MLPLTFINPDDYDRIEENDRISVLGLADLTPGNPVTVEVRKSNGDTFTFETTHTFSEEQIKWFVSGSALNVIREQTAAD